MISTRRGRKKLGRLAKIKRRLSLASLLLIALVITGLASATGYFLVTRIHQETVVQEVAQITTTERVLPATITPGKTITCWYVVKPINDYPNPLTVKIEATVVGIDVIKWEVSYDVDVDGNITPSWNPYTMGADIILSDYPNGIGLSLSGTIQSLDEIIDGIASVDVELYRMT